MTCGLCERKANPADELYHWNGPGRSHCNTCHADWRQASNAMHCVTCHRTFRAPSLCDQHQEFGQCEPPEKFGMVAVENQWGSAVYRSKEEIDA